MIGDDEYQEFTKHKMLRDGSKFHITVINVMDYNRLCKDLGIDDFINSLEPIFKYEIDDIRMKGIGTATKGENRTFFIVCKSDKLEAIRTRFDLPEFDFHITLGFKNKDVHSVRKNMVITKNQKFLKLLRVEFYKKNNWDFVKEIGNFKLDKLSDVVPVALNDNYLKVKCDGNIMDISLLDNQKFWIMTQYPITKENDLPRLAETEIIRILNKN